MTHSFHTCCLLFPDSELSPSDQKIRLCIAGSYWLKDKVILCEELNTVIPLIKWLWHKIETTMGLKLPLIVESVGLITSHIVCFLHQFPFNCSMCVTSLRKVPRLPCVPMFPCPDLQRCAAQCSSVAPTRSWSQLSLFSQLQLCTHHTPHTPHHTTLYSTHYTPHHTHTTLYSTHYTTHHTTPHTHHIILHAPHPSK